MHKINIICRNSLLRLGSQHSRIKNCKRENNTQIISYDRVVTKTEAETKTWAYEGCFDIISKNVLQVKLMDSDPISEKDLAPRLINNTGLYYSV